MLTEQDYKIIDYLLDAEEPQTKYAISQATRISQPQVGYRLQKLMDEQIIVSERKGIKCLYRPTSFLVCPDCIGEFIEHMSGMADILEGHHGHTGGLKALAEYIINKTQITKDE